MTFTREQITSMLRMEGTEQAALLARAHEVRVQHTGKAISLRGLIEYSNRCRKNCLYCGIRSGMKDAARYTLPDGQVLDAARSALREGYGSVVIQGGEITSPQHIGAIETLVRRIKALTPASVGLTPEQSAGWDDSLGITLSLGEQSSDTYRRWFDAGASRYLLRIESSDPALFRSIHPGDGRHLQRSRLRALDDLRRAGFQVGTGVMIGLPDQTVEHLAADLQFMADRDIDMCGMGPYIESAGTPMAGMAVPPLAWRLNMTLRMIAVLRLMMPDSNIAAATALDAIDPQGRRMALESGANVLMPNITPGASRDRYRLYDNKPSGGEQWLSGFEVNRGKRGDSPRFIRRGSQ